MVVLKEENRGLHVQKKHVMHQGREQVTCKHVHTCLCAGHICELLTFSFPLQSTGSTRFSVSLPAVARGSCSTAAWRLLWGVRSGSQILAPVNLSEFCPARDG